MRRRTQLAARVDAVKSLQGALDDAVTLIELGEGEGDKASVEEGEAEIARLTQRARKAQLESLLSGEADANNAYLDVNSGAGGTEAQDWALMLLRMYSRWAEQHGYKVEDSQARRHTSFASVWVYPEVDDDIEIEILDKDVRVDTYRASGAGGQHVNKTDSAVRLTHIPTNIVVQCQAERSQHKNRATAWKMLRAKMYEHELRKREAVAAATEASKTDIGWGHQIRSYVLQPYQMVKDLRTGVQTSNTQGVLGGEIDDFIEAALAQRVKGSGPAKVDDID